ncbi:protein deglycase HchA [Mycobacteroides immunogenum]|uniref:glyoxalase III HchA n=1 Tax=Mycobacteroides immunogenum TaxID=83262 RepID=UPI0025B75B93|nr:glyoxalase III HchA [Mycobacteroides immunogenum]WJR31815.1 protein deglycase HchA [Mycobacteroides immunogenum]
MTTSAADLSKAPVADPAEYNAFFPSAYSLTKYVGPKSDFGDAEYPNPYTGGRWKVLLIATEERYLLTQNGTFFSTGNHPLELLLPLLHFDAAGFEVDIATISGNPVKFELWAFPAEDAAVKAGFEKFLPKFKQPLNLSEVVQNNLGPDSDYIALFVPGGHGVINGIPSSELVGESLQWALDNDKYIVTLCHGPVFLASLLAVGASRDEYPLKGYEITVFPDALDEGANLEIGYIPGRLVHLVAKELEELGLKVLNTGITGQVHQDRKLLTGDSPLASNNLGKLAAPLLLEEAGKS